MFEGFVRAIMDDRFLVLLGAYIWWKQTEDKMSNSPVVVESTRKSTQLKYCAHCLMNTPHWSIRNNRFVCGFCGTEHEVIIKTS
jgi:hypothetical protein